MVPTMAMPMSDEERRTRQRIVPGKQRVQEEDEEHRHRRRHADARRLQPHFVKRAQGPFRGLVLVLAVVPEELAQGPQRSPRRSDGTTATLGRLAGNGREVSGLLGCGDAPWRGRGLRARRCAERHSVRRRLASARSAPVTDDGRAMRPGAPTVKIVTVGRANIRGRCADVVRTFDSKEDRGLRDLESTECVETLC